MILALLCAPVSCAVGESPPHMSVVSSAVDPDLDPLLRPRKHGWLGGDGAASVRLPDGKLLWLFMDTFIGSLDDSGRRIGGMVNNTIALHNPAKEGPSNVRFYWKGDGKEPRSFFDPPEGLEDSFFWPFAGAIADKTLFVFGYCVMSTGEGGAFGFKVGEGAVVIVANPLEDPKRWQIETKAFGFGGEGWMPCSAAWLEGDWIYLLGSDGSEGISRAVLARAKARQLRHGAAGDAIEFWCRDGRWSREPGTLRPLFEPGASEGSLFYDQELGEYVAVLQPGLSGPICMRTAREITGPWTGPLVMHTPSPPPEGVFAYAGKAHPALSHWPDIVLTYATNSFSFEAVVADSTVYYPRFVRASMSAD